MSCGQKQPQKQPQLVNEDVIADYFDVRPRTVQTWAAQGKIPHYRCGGKTIRYDLGEVKEALHRKAAS